MLVMLKVPEFWTGIVTNKNRSYSHVIVWNDPNTQDSAPACNSSSKNGVGVVIRSWNAILSTLANTVRVLEVNNTTIFVCIQSLFYLRFDVCWWITLGLGRR